MNVQNEKTDAELLTEFSEGVDRAAFAELVRRHGPMVHSVALRVLCNHHDAQDITQTAFVVLAREASNLTGQPSVASWLYTVCRRLSLNAQESRASREYRENLSMSDQIPISPEPVVAREFRAELDHALAQLPDHYHQPLVLYYLEGLPLAEVADRLTLNSNTVRTRLSRARHSLRRALARRGVKSCSLGTLSALLTSSAKAAPVSPVFYSTLLDTALNQGAHLAPQVQKLIKEISVSPSLAIQTLSIIMKAKTTSIVTLCALALIGSRTYVTNSSSSKTMEKERTDRQFSSRRMTQVSSDLGGQEDPFSQMNSEEIDELWDSVMFISDPTERLEAIRTRLGCQISDELYESMLKKLGFRSDSSDLKSVLLKDWSRTNPRKFLTWTKRFGKREYGHELFEQIHEEWALLSLMDSGKEADRKYVEEKYPSFLNQIDEARKWSGWSRFESSEVLKTRAEELGSQLLLTTTKNEKLDRNAVEVSPSTSTQMAKYKKEIQSKFKEVIVRLMESDPVAAAELMEKFSPEIVHDVVSYWAPVDPDAAYEWAMNVEESDLRNAALMQILRPLALKYPDRKLDISMLSEKGQSEILSEIIGDWAFTHSRQLFA